MRKDLVVSFIVGFFISLGALALVPEVKSFVRCWRQASVVDQRIQPELTANDATHPEPTTEQGVVHA